MELPQGCNYNLTLYDEYGNQVGKAAWNGDNKKTLTIPNWDTSTNKYSIKIENENGEEVSPDDYYKISFHVIESQEHKKTDAITEAYGAWQIAKSRDLPEQQEYLDRYNALLQEAETNYTKEVEQLHQKQYESLPAEKQYKGSLSAEELLQDMTKGRELNEAELEYVKIFSNLKDYEKAQQKAELKDDFSTSFCIELESMGISKEDVEGMQIKIASNGSVSVDGIENQEIKTQVENLIEKKYGDRLYQYYIGISNSIGDLSNNVYEYATDVQEVNRQLKTMTGDEVEFSKNAMKCISAGNQKTMLCSDALMSYASPRTGESINIYRADNYSKESPIYLVKGLDADGNAFEQEVDASKGILIYWRKKCNTKQIFSCR